MIGTQSRRGFLAGVAGAAVGAHATAGEFLSWLGEPGGSAEDAARNEDYWSEIARAFTVDRSVINLNNGGVSPSPRWVQEAMKRHLDYANTMPPARVLWSVQKPQLEGVRDRLAGVFGVDAEELAITRNASEGLEILQFGLPLDAGDEVLCASFDYPRMMETFRQRERRDGIRLVEVEMPVPAEDDDEVVRRYADAITPRTRMILVSHVVFVNGQIMPAARIAALGREREISVLVDGAHALAHRDFTIGDLDCDFYATSLHKWLFAPHGTGLLYIRRERIPEVWSLMASAKTQDGDIRKFEEIGTHPYANSLAIAEALTFYEGIGAARKAARLRFLKTLWADPLVESDRVVLRTSMDPRFSCGIATFEIDGLESGELVGYLWREHRILTTSVAYGGVTGVRVSPSVYTTPGEIDRFVGVVEGVIRDGLT